MSFEIHASLFGNIFVLIVPGLYNIIYRYNTIIIIYTIKYTTI